MSLVDHLLANRTPLELAKLAAHEAKDNARLRDELHAVKTELFWLKVPQSTICNWCGWPDGEHDPNCGLH